MQEGGEAGLRPGQLQDDQGRGEVRNYRDANRQVNLNTYCVSQK